MEPSVSTASPSTLDEITTYKETSSITLPYYQKENEVRLFEMDGMKICLIHSPDATKTITCLRVGSGIF